jgi:hypothetical protein
MTNQNEDVEDAASPSPKETPQLQPRPGGTVNSGKLPIDEGAP